ncbi:12100_t:CDS:2, partial [Acaulospora colombiana]
PASKTRRGLKRKLNHNSSAPLIIWLEQRELRMARDLAVSGGQLELRRKHKRRSQGQAPDDGEEWAWEMTSNLLTCSDRSPCGGALKTHHFVAPNTRADVDCGNEKGQLDKCSCFDYGLRMMGNEWGIMARQGGGMHLGNVEYDMRDGAAAALIWCE